MAFPAPRLVLSGLFDPVHSGDPVPRFRMLSGGRWVEASKTFDVDTPIDGTVIARVPRASREEMERAVGAADLHSIRDAPAIERIEVFERARALLLEHLDDFARTIHLEAGKPLKDAQGEARATADRLKLAMEEARSIFGEYIPGDWSEDTLGKVAIVIREPVGLVAAISPFNYPLYIGAAKVIPALLAGNAVVLKPASEDPLSSLLFARVLEEAGLPPGALSVVTGSGSEAGRALAADPRPGLLSFTGSTEVGKELSTLAGLKRRHLELGGKGAAIVLEDADLALAAERCVEGSFKNAGQRCDAVGLVLAVEAVADRLVEGVLKAAEPWMSGDPRGPEVRVGPLIHPSAAGRVLGLVEDAVKKGAKLLRGGKGHGAYVEPTVLDRVPADARIATEETFGPVVAIRRVKDAEEALAAANSLRFGLDTCLFSRDFYSIWRLAKGLRSGGVAVNDMPRHGVGYFPFGGTKESGVGREGVGYSVEEMTILKTIAFNLEPGRLGKRKHPRM